MLQIRIIGLVVALAIAGGVYAITSGGGSSASQISQDVTSVPGDGAKTDSLYHAANLDKALAKFTSKFGAGTKISTFKLEPNSIKVTSTTGDLIVGKHFETEGIALPAAAGAALGSGGTITVADIDTAAPAKIVANLASKGVTLGNVDYFIISKVFSEGKIGWDVYTTGNGDFAASEHGSKVEPLGSSTTTTITGGSSSGTSSASSAEKQAKQAAKAAQGAASSAQSSASATQSCITKAGTDPTKLAACAGQ
jgi:hypothetical protein